MSWSVKCVGKPENVIAYLEKESAKLTGQCKVEFDDALPHIVALVRQTFASPESGYTCPTIKLEANGSGTAKKQGQDGPEVQLQRQCTVKIEPVWLNLV